ncbi:hypothetical protein P0Y35_08015 [Kiritimatiellaeota bacterium B1221]|nr:hypothetical protein [Kiritimatiellaeota bacterium B1221]
MRHPTYLFLVFALVSTLIRAAGTLEVRAPGYDFRSAEYSTSHVYIDEVAGTTADIEVLYDLTGFSQVTDVEVYTNLNRRDLVRIDKNSDGYADGIQPVDGNTITDSPADTDPATGHYFAPVNMVYDGTHDIWALTIPASKTGAYRLTARFKTSDAIAENKYNSDNWIWYGLRDHAVVVAPVDSRDVQLYVMNVFNVEASGDTFATRSTLEDLHDAPDAAHNFGGGGSKWNLDYLKGLGMNWLWFQPIHPVGIDGREPVAGYGNGGPLYDPGSPYSVKNFFEVNELMTVDYNGANTSQQNRDAAMAAFQEFAAAADAKSVGIMLDAPFNHTAFDVELAQIGVDLFQRDGETWLPTDEIRNREARFFSSSSNYGNRASSAGDIAAGPDRYDFGKWNDVKDVFFGRYDALVEYDDGGAELNSYKNEGDWFDYSDSDWTTDDFIQGGEPWNVTRRVWDYFAGYAVHWLEKTRPAGENRNSTSADGDLAARYTWDARGIDGLRCDFGQGLPPQAWEYIINVARSYKWNFVMMSESLDGGAVTYRSSRHFEILNENIVFPLKSSLNSQNYRDIFEERRSAYGQALVLANTTSHDEENYEDPWEAVVRNAAAGIMDSASLIFPGQELGISKSFGYQHYELNFSKTISHFKRWNSMTPAWNDSDPGNDQLYPVYAGIQTARNQSPALRSSNRYFLTGDGGNDQIFAAAKYETANASPATSDVVIAFANVDRDNDQSDNFKIPAGLAPLLGIEDGRMYNAKNMAAYIARDSTRREQFLWGSGISGADLKSGGFTVFMKKVPTTADDPGTTETNEALEAWASAPYEAQYLKVYDVTAPVSAPVQPEMPNPFPYALGASALFDWDPVAADAGGVVPHYEVQIFVNGGLSDTVVVSDPAMEVTASLGDEVHVQVKAVNPYQPDHTGPASVVSETVKLLDPAADEDADGQSNEDEDQSGTNPRDGASVFQVVNPVMSGADVSFTIEVVPGYLYTVQSTTDLADSESWASEDEVNAVNYAPGIAESEYTYTDLSPSTLPKFYRVLVVKAP